MILWASRVTSEIEPAWKEAPLRAWRWVFEVDRWCIGLTEQVKFNHREPDSEWGNANCYYLASVSTNRARWHVGFHHMYYDGPHHVLWLGPLSISWMSDRWCLTCMPERDESEPLDIGAFVGDVIAAAMGVNSSNKEVEQ